MAGNNRNDSIATPSRKVKKELDILSRKLDGIYKDVYITRPDNKNNLDIVMDDLDNAINRLASVDNDNVATMSELIRRLDKKDKATVEKLNSSLSDMFNDNNLVGQLFANTDLHKYIAAENYNYDMICKYLPKLNIALEIMRDNVLSSDNFSNKFLNPKSVYSSKEEISLFTANSDRLENRYELSNFLSDLYYKTSKYGETFVYLVPYTKAFERLLTSSRYRANGMVSRSTSLTYYESEEKFWKDKESVVCLEAGYAKSSDYKSYVNNVEGSSSIIESFNDKATFEGSQIRLHFNYSGVALNPVNEIAVSAESTKNIRESVSTIFTEDGNKRKTEGSLASEYDKISDAAYNRDGLIVDNMDKDIKIDQNITGSVLEMIPREDIIPVYIGKTCLGYYYFEIQEDKGKCGYCGGHHMTPMISNATAHQYEMSADQEELAIRYISSKISQSIDSKFINANKDLKEEIYAVLRYNEKFDIARTNDIGVTFIPAEDMIHCYFKFDEDTHRGVSDLRDSLIPAMLYILLYLSDIIGKITRGTDKRVYYVKQNVEQNVARTMMNVVNQIKKGNMGMRQIESMNNILNIVGKYNDYIIPLGPSGDPPIQFEVMQGQQIDTPTDMMDKMEELAVNSTGTPFEMVNSTFQQDFAVRFSMSNTRFLKLVYERQRRTSELFSVIFTRLYNNEFDEEYSKIKIQLPPPVYLTMTNNQQLLDNVSQMADKLIEFELPNAEDEVKSEFKKLYIRNTLGTYIDYDFVDHIIETAKVNVESQKPPATEDGEYSSDDLSEDEGF